MTGRTELFFYVSVAVGMALATSSFVVLSGIFRIAGGPIVLLSIALAGVFCYVLSLSIAELASMFPSAPGIRTYLKPALGERISLVLVYLYLVFTVLMAGVEGYMFAAVARTVVPEVPAPLIAVVLISGITGANLAGLELPRGTQMVITTIYVLLLTGLSVLTLAVQAPPIIQHTNLSTSTAFAIPAATGMAIFLFMGFEWATPIGLRPKSYRRLIPLSLPLSIVVLTVIYLLFCVAAVHLLPESAIAGTSTPQLTLYQTLLGPEGRLAALAMSCCAILCTLNAGIMGGSRLVFMLAREGHLPPFCARMSIRTGAPIGGSILLGAAAIVAAVLVIVLEIQLVIAVVGAAVMCCVYSAFALAALLLRRARPNSPRPYRTPVPAFAQWGLVVILPLLGLGSLLSLPATSAVAATIGVVIAALCLTHLSSSRVRVQ